MERKDGRKDGPGLAHADPTQSQCWHCQTHCKVQARSRLSQIISVLQRFHLCLSRCLLMVCPWLLTQASKPSWRHCLSQTWEFAPRLTGHMVQVLRTMASSSHLSLACSSASFGNIRLLACFSTLYLRLCPFALFLQVINFLHWSSTLFISIWVSSFSN